MTARYVAFLRGINVGGHTVKKADLCAPFETIGLANVTSFIASGNIIFDTDKAGAESGLERRIEGELKAALGYDVATFVRSVAEVASVAEQTPFGPDEPASGTSLIVGFLKQAPSASVPKALADLSSDVDQFKVKGRELYWLARQGIARSTVKDHQLAKALGRVDITTRNITTVRKLAAKSAPG